MLVLDVLSGADTEQYVVWTMVRLTQVVHVVRANQR